MNRRLICQAIAFLALLGACSSGALAQTEGSKLRLKDYRPVENATRSRATVSTGSLTVVAAPGATIYLELIGSQRSDKRQGLIGQEIAFFIFNELRPGRYRVSAELSGHQEAEDQEVTVVPGKTQGVEFRLRPITYTPTIKTNVKTGTIGYVIGGVKIVRDIQNSTATLPNLPAGVYEIEISTTEVGYRPLKDRIEVGAGRTAFEKKLEHKVSEGILASSWTSLDGWDVPSGWSISSRILHVNGPGVGLPRNENFRYYTDFSLVSDVKLVNDMAVSLVLRAQDKQNYYLIQITGGKADEANVLRGFVVKDGASRRLQDSISVGGYAGKLTGEFFELTIECVKNKFTVSISDQNGERQTLGVLTDYDSHFPIGAAGIAARAQEQNDISRFIVTPLPAR
jgi:hypothetical protein